MTLRSPAKVGRAALVLLAALAGGRAFAADMPEDYLRGPIIEDPLGYARWSGLHLGGHVGYSNLNMDPSDATTASLAESSTSSTAFGGFIGYNFQWDNLVVGIDGAHNRPASLETSVRSGTSSATLKLVDYGTLRMRGGYAFGQFLFYGFVGGAVGRMNYATVDTGVTASSRDGAFAGGFTAGLGLDVAILPNVFVRGEYEYIAFSPVGVIRSSTNTARVGIGVRF